MDTLAERRKEFSKVLNIHLESESAVDFAESVEVSPQYVSDLRKGKRAPSRDFLERIMKAKA